MKLPKSLFRRFRRLKIRLLSPFINLERWVAYRTYDKYHVVKTDLKPNYYDTDVVLLHACFSLLVDFVEIECAALNFQKDEKKPTLKEILLRKISWPWPISQMLPAFRSIEKGMDYVVWMANGVEVTEDRKYWEEIKFLYTWWKAVRPYRKPPNDAVGLAELFTQFDAKYPEGIHYFVPCGNDCVEMKMRLTEEEDNALKSLSLKALELEKKYREEDTEMLHRLINVRDFLWT